MKIKRLGRTGLRVPEVCLGTMTFASQSDEKAAFQIMDLAADKGITFFDTADVYPIPVTVETAGRTEEIVGKWLRGKRNNFVLATKCGMKMGEGSNDAGLSRQTRTGGDRGKPQTAWHRLCRPVSGSFARSCDTDR